MHHLKRSVANPRIGIFGGFMGQKSSLTTSRVTYTFKRKPLIICGPSGVGKGTITDLLLKEFPNNFAKAVSHTTRSPRPGEMHGREYFYVKDIDTMRRAIENGGFLEHATVHGNLYGTSFESLKQIEESGRICVLDIDVNGLRQIIRATTPSTLNRVGIVPVSMEDLEKRLRSRGTETEENVKKRLMAAKGEIHAILHDHIVDQVIHNADSWKVGYP